MWDRLKKFINKKSVDLIGSAQEIFGYWGRTNYRNNYSYSHFHTLCNEVYNNSPDFQEAVNLIAQECAELPICFRDEEGKKQMPTMSPQLKNFLKAPLSSGEDFSEFVRTCFVPWYVSGEIILIKKQGIEMGLDPDNFDTSMPIDSVSVIPPNQLMKVHYNDGTPNEYEVSSTFFLHQNGLKSSKGSATGRKKYEVEYKGGKLVSQVAMMIRTNSIIYGRGIGFASALINDIQILSGGRVWNRSVLENGGKPSGVFFYPPRSIGATENATRVSAGKRVSTSASEEKLKQNFSGSTNAGNFLLLKGGLQFKETMYNMRDLDWLEGLNFSRRSICQLLCIPPELFGSQETSTFNNKKESREFFVSNVCVAQMNKFLNFLSSKVLYGHFKELDGLTLCVDEDKVEESIKKKTSLRDSLGKANFLSFNEKREQIGLPPLEQEEGDKILVPKNMIYLEDVGMEEPDPFMMDDPAGGGDKEPKAE